MQYINRYRCEWWWFCLFVKLTVRQWPIEKKTEQNKKKEIRKEKENIQTIPIIQKYHTIELWQR